MYVSEKLLKNHMKTVAQIKAKMPLHSEQDKKDLKRAREYVETYQALELLKKLVHEIKMMEYQEAKKSLRETP